MTDDDGHVQAILDPRDHELTILRAIAYAARDFEQGLSDYCDGPERTILRALLQGAGITES